MMIKKRETICFLIFAVGKANGGHYRSLRTIAESLSNNYHVLIINVGYVHSNIILNSKVKNYFVYFNGLNFISPINQIKKLLHNFNVIFFHAFDHQSFFLSRILSNIFKVPAIHTKCGGRNPKGYYPQSDYLTLFSYENYQYFSTKVKYKQSLIKLIPNRVETFKSDWDKIQRIKNKHGLDNSQRIFLRICRISYFYAKSIKQSIDLIKELNTSNIEIALLIVGNIQNEEVFESLIDYSKNIPNIYFETDHEIIKDAKQIIDIADFVIGTGRGFMEACCKSKIMLAPANNHKLPVLINEINFKDAFHKNFSERIDFDKNTLANNLRNIRELLYSKQTLDNSKQQSYIWFIDYFAIEYAKKEYINFYKNVFYKGNSLPDLLFHWLFVIHNNLGTWYRNIYI